MYKRNILKLNENVRFFPPIYAKKYIIEMTNSAILIDHDFYFFYLFHFHCIRTEHVERCQLAKLTEQIKVYTTDQGL